MNGRLYAAICTLVAASLACGTLQVSVEGTQAADIAATGTLGALQTQISELATRAAAPTSASISFPSSATPGPGPLGVTATPIPATRITFLNDATAAVVSAPIGPGESQTYVMDIYQVQPMMVNVKSTASDVTVSIRAQNGATLLSASAHESSWRGNLPTSGDYYLTVHGGTTPENFTLVISVPLPLYFAQGSNSVTVDGSTVAGYDVSYSVYALQGQKMNIDIERGSTKGSLAVFGFQDGKQYLRADQGDRTYHLKLPMTQEYIVSVVPFQGLVVDYILTITIQ